MARLRPREHEALDVRAMLMAEWREDADRYARVVYLDDGTCYANPAAARLARLEAGESVDVPGSTLSGVYWRAKRSRPAWLRTSTRYRVHADGTITPIDRSERTG